MRSGSSTCLVRLCRTLQVSLRPTGSAKNQAPSRPSLRGPPFAARFSLLGRQPPWDCTPNTSVIVARLHRERLVVALDPHSTACVVNA
jgi:hypothetical protein